MKIAILSDIHGNYPALQKVLKDAKKRGIDDFMFVGDYCLSGAWPDECIKTLMDIPRKVIIRGNEEIYLENLIGKDQSTWTDGQMQISYWCYRNIEPNRLKYILALPQTAECEINGVKIHVAHSSDAFLGDYEFGKMGPSKLSLKYAGAEVTQESLKRDIDEILDGDPVFSEKLGALEDGIYVFGHSHVQWSYRSEKKNVMLINPGSCGLPLDAIRNSIPYTVLTVTEDGGTSLEEVRLPFSMDAYIEELRRTTQYTGAEVWSKVIFRELLTAREHLNFFLQFVNEYAEKTGDPQRPFSVKTWEAAYDEWESTQGRL